jgi:hypothetical protein
MDRRHPYTDVITIACATIIVTAAVVIEAGAFGKR